jgi:transposase
MEITLEQFNRFETFLPVQRGNVSLTNLQVVNAILYVAENGCKRRSLPKRFGNWHTIYTRMNRWAKAGVLDRLFDELQHQQLVVVRKNLVKAGQTRGRTRGAVRRGSPWLGLCTILGADGANWSMSNRLRQAADRERQDRAPCVDARRCNGLPKFAESTANVTLTAGPAYPDIRVERCR